MSTVVECELRNGGRGKVGVGKYWVTTGSRRRFSPEEEETGWNVTEKKKKTRLTKYSKPLEVEGTATVHIEKASNHRHQLQSTPFQNQSGGGRRRLGKKVKTRRLGRDLIMSNGMFKSPVHRVVTNSERERLTLAVFCLADSKMEIGLVEELIDGQRLRL
ncbi:hypothetical protein RHMOL_Rhmol05G0230500 [Rhododendron molle]|uniref:Uncharacterized protein n=1 Tax=Rhododendron molle TaxID=49168 RepID=A0ACC0NTB7_RHOML|nr:hypothetical protein RHMOL_Rhmol05G0230500 [Rhododendron molle]